MVRRGGLSCGLNRKPWNAFGVPVLRLIRRAVRFKLGVLNNEI